ncbi:MAG: hypothetical protein MIO92_12235 [Methanosarcinaceae archaeon]|nr:hypothetical protein [Methanosarcinaceae archaeon]
MSNTRILYLEAVKRDFISKFLLANTGWYLRPEDGRIDTKRRMHPDPPWVYVKHTPGMNCPFWHRILFDIIHERKKVPIPCQSCWKVVFAPKDIVELMATYGLMQKLNVPGKLGTEGNRPNSDKLYGAYFYNKSKEEGLRKYDQVTKEMSKGLYYEYSLFGVPIRERIEADFIDRIILKRACTEFEQNVGPSDKWSWDEDQAETELLAEDAFVQDVVIFKQNEHMIAHIIASWIHHANQWHDLTYKKFTNGNALFAKLVTYHNLKPVSLTVTEQESPQEEYSTPELSQEFKRRNSGPF